MHEEEEEEQQQLNKKGQHQLLQGFVHKGGEV